MTRVDPKTPYTDDYLETLKSPAWAELKERKRVELHDTCEMCGAQDTALELHHKHYRSIGCETENDVLLLCPACHKAADNERIYKRWKQRYRAIVTFGDKKYGRGWAGLVPFRQVASEFDRWLEWRRAHAKSKKGRKAR